jgi:hypothetical protein
MGVQSNRWWASDQNGHVVNSLEQHRRVKADGIWGGGSEMRLLSKSITEGIEAEEGHDTNFAVETL